MVFGGRKIILLVSFFCALLGFLVGIIPIYTQLCVVELQYYTPVHNIRLCLLYNGTELYIAVPLQISFVIRGAAESLPESLSTLVSLHTITEIRFRTSNEYGTAILFFALQERIFAPLGETSLIFFRIENTTVEALTVYVLYYVYPEDVRLFLYKVQCFCFSEIFVDQQILLDLPVLFYISTTIHRAICYLCYTIV